MTPQEIYRAFWARMERCKTIAALESEFLKEHHRQHGAAQSTVEALMYSLRERGIAALAEPDTRRRLSELSSAQIAECMDRMVRNRARYADADDLLMKFWEQAQ